MKIHLSRRTSLNQAGCFVVWLALAAVSRGFAFESASGPPAISPYGTWSSPISTAALAESSIQLSDLRAVGPTLYWTENRPTENGRLVIFSLENGAVRPVTPTGFNVRTRVHEYGGAAYVATGQAIYFSHLDDQRLYVQRASGAPQPVTSPGYRYADCVQRAAERDLICVREDHTGGDGAGGEKNSNVRVGAGTESAGTVLFSNTDFVAYPRVRADGKKIAWIAWNHPNMPWDSTTLYVADLTPKGLVNTRVVAGGHDESVLEPQWDADGALYFLSDRHGFWNLYRWSGNAVSPVVTLAAEFARPLWTLGQSNYVLFGDGVAVARYGVDMVDHLAVIDLKRGTLRELHLPFVGYDSLQMRDRDHAVMIADSADQPPAIVSVELKTGKVEVLRRPTPMTLMPALISRAQPIDFPTTGGAVAHAFFYPPQNPAYSSPPSERPPLIVQVHGGPTGAATSDFSPRIQYWTSRGFALVDVNYGGSSGYGRAYRERLRGNWGVTDVQDVIAAVQFLIARGKVDAQRVIIHGGSAGGYTVLGALSQSDIFKAGTDYFGISDMTVLARDTHKFESRYLDGLIAPYPAGRALYEARSPLNHLSGFKAPLLVLQGSEDPVVPPSQARMIVDALRARHATVAYIEFPGEGHGFRKAENNIRATEAELYFYGRVFGFVPFDKLPPLEIDNLPAH